MGRKKIFLLSFAFATIMESAIAQKESDYSEEKLKAVEAQFLYNYYSQEGNHSAVTGGIGTEKLSNNASEMIVNIPLRKAHTINIAAGIDAYSSASSDNINPNTVSGPSSSDVRYHLQAGYGKEFESIGLSVGINGNLSNEYDYASSGYGMSISKNFNQKNTKIGLSFNGFYDTWLLIFPIELRASRVSTDKRQSNAFSLFLTQVLTPQLQIGIFVDRIEQNGLLATPFHRVYFKDYEQGKTAKIESLPGYRLKYAFGTRIAYHWDVLISRIFYRYYSDDFGIKSHTINLKLPIKTFETITLAPFGRYYTQTASTYFQPFQQHSVNTPYYTSDFDFSEFQSSYLGIEFTYRPIEKLNWSWLRIKEIAVQYANYYRTDGLVANTITGGITFQF